jgi:hypothetical protein
MNNSYEVTAGSHNFVFEYQLSLKENLKVGH